MNDVLEIFGCYTKSAQKIIWRSIVAEQNCPFVNRKCFKVRKSQPDISIGTCSVAYGRENQPVIICPLRLLERRKIFTDSLHLLSLHEPGNDLHVVSEVSVPGGTVDFFLVSARKGKPIDFVGIELQTLDTTGTVWPAREKFLQSVGTKFDAKAIKSTKSFGMNWKMTAKTILVQLHHKVETFEYLSKHLVLVVQDCLLNYMRREFTFGHLNSPRTGDVMHFHVYSFKCETDQFGLELKERYSTDTAGIATALGLQAEARVKLKTIMAELEKKLSPETMLKPA